MARERASDKALRLIADGQVRVRRMALLGCEAEVVGDTGRHMVVLNGRWSCTCHAGCSAKRGLCSHAQAVSLVRRACLATLR